MSDGSGEIIIKGGSCEIHFDSALFEKDPNDPKRHFHTHDAVKIKRIVITGNQEFDSEDMTDGFVGDITITYRL